MGCVSSSSKGSQGAGVAQVGEPSALPILTEVSAEERALMQLKAIFDGMDKSRDGDVSKAALVAALGKDPSLGALIKSAGFDQDYNALDTLRTCTQGRITWVEFQSNLRKTVVAQSCEGGNAAESPVDDASAADAKEIAQKVTATLVLGLLQQQEEQHDQQQQQELPMVKIEDAVMQGGVWCC